MPGDGPMHVRVPLFARQRELAGEREVAFELAAGATVEDAWSVLAARFPAIASGRPFVRFARNGDYAEAGTALADGDEIACIPPISGGADAGDPATHDSVIRRFELHAEPFPPTFAHDLADAVATPADGACRPRRGVARVRGPGAACSSGLG
jgi:molybdopterin converting factor subunit 1